MDSEKIILTKDIFRVLASERRVTILKKLAQRRMTTSELSRELKIAKSTVHEHLVLMTTADLISPVPDEHQWKYYEITRKGENLLLPENSMRIIILLSSIGPWDKIRLCPFLWPMRYYTFYDLKVSNSPDIMCNKL